MRNYLYIKKLVFDNREQNLELSSNDQGPMTTRREVYYAIDKINSEKQLNPTKYM